MRRSLWSWAALAAASAAILCAAPAQYLGRQQDDLLYIIGSQSLAHGSYRLFTCIGQPPLTAVVPGFSILLLPVTWLCGARAGAYQAFCALALAGLPWLLWRWLRRRLDEPDSALVTLLFATSPLVLCQSGTVMSEGPYAILAVLLLAAIEAGRWPEAGALFLALTQVRLAGLSLLPAVLARPWQNRDWRAAGQSLLPAAAAAMAWYAWSRCVSWGAGEFHGIELRASYQGQGWLHPAAVAFDNARFYLTEWGGGFLPLRWGGLAWLAGTGLSCLVLRGAWRLRRDAGSRPALLMLAGAALLHAFWPWQYDRYLIPLLPWLLWLLAAGIGTQARWLLGLLLALQLGLHSQRWLRGVEQWRRPELARTYAWLNSRAAAADSLASALYVRDGFLALRPSTPLLDEDGPDRLAQTLRRRRVRFVLWQDDLDVGLSAPRGSAIARKLDRIRLQLQDDGRFGLVHEEPLERTRVYELR